MSFARIKAAGSTIIKALTSVGQTYFCIDQLGKYLFEDENDTRTHVMLGFAIFGGLGVNFFLRGTANIRYYCRPAAAKNENQPIKLNVVASLIKYLLNASVHTSAFFTGLGAYFGTIMVSQLIADLLESDDYDVGWKFYLIQGASLINAGVLVANFYSYDNQFLSANAQEIAENVEQRHFPLNKAVLYTFGVCGITVVSGPMIAYFWTTPSLEQIPKYEVFIEGAFGNIINGFAIGSAFLTTATTLPSIYHSFQKSEKNSFPSTCLSKSLLGITILSGGLDSIASGGCTYLAWVNTGEKFEPRGLVIAFAMIAGVSGGFNNALFFVRSGYLEMMKDIYKNQLIETTPLLQENHSDTEKKSGSFYSKENLKITLYGSGSVNNYGSFEQNENENEKDGLLIERKTKPNNGK